MASTSADPELQYFFADREQHPHSREDFEGASRRTKVLKGITTIIISSALLGAMLLSAVNGVLLL